MKTKLLLLVIAVLILIAGYIVVLWWADPLTPITEWPPVSPGSSQSNVEPSAKETEEPMLILNGEKVICDPFDEIRKDRDGTRAKYLGKSVLLHGIALDRYSCDGGFFLRCSGARGSLFYLRVNDDTNFQRVQLKNRVVASAVLNQIWSGHRDYFDYLTVWDGKLQEIQQATGNGWSVIWRLTEQ
jgi:hypothetical protein